MLSDMIWYGNNNLFFVSLVLVSLKNQRYWQGLFFEPSVMRGGEGIMGPHHNFVAIIPMIMKFGTEIELDLFYTMATKKLINYYYVIMTS